MNKLNRPCIIIYGWLCIIASLNLDCQRAATPVAWLIPNQWLIQPDSQNVGLKNGWFRSGFSRLAATEENFAFTTNPTIQVWWGFNDFSFTPSQNSAIKWGLRWSVVFDSLQIWLNDQELLPPLTIGHGSNVDLTSALRPGKNLLTLRLVHASGQISSIGAWEIFPYSDPAELAEGFYYRRPLPDSPQWLGTAVFLEVFLNENSPYQTYPQLQAEIPDFVKCGFSALCLNCVLLAPESTQRAAASDLKWLTLNPRAGSVTDFQRLIQVCHDSGMHVILDLDCYRFAPGVPAITESRPAPSTVNQPADLGLKAAAAGFQIVLSEQFQPQLLKIAETYKIDGFRCRGVSGLNLPFWQNLRRALNANSPRLLVGDAAEPGLSALAFDAIYSFGTYHLLEQVLRDSITTQAFSQYFVSQHYLYPVGTAFWRAQNNWGDTPAPQRAYSQLGAERSRLALILTYTLPGNPVLTLPWPAFFTIAPALAQKTKHSDALEVLNNFYLQYADVIKKGEFIPLPVQANGPVLAFVRRHGPREFLVILNLAGQEVTAQLTTRGLKGYRQDLFKKVNLNVAASQTRVVLPAWDFRIYVNARFQIVQTRSQYIPLGENPANPKLAP
ncbi:hypothetical protein L0128_10260 [candidate division KSB1 bacterium]|nr:hypothetical protein [candidate division KSB1 bacterium]